MQDSGLHNLDIRLVIQGGGERGVGTALIEVVWAESVVDSEVGAGGAGSGILGMGEYRILDPDDEAEISSAYFEKRV